LLINWHQATAIGGPYDLSGRGNNGSEFNMDATADVKKGFVRAKWFDGDAGITFNYPVTTDFDFGNGVTDIPFSLGGWYQVTDTGLDQMMLNKYNLTSGVGEWELVLGSSERVILILRDQNNTVDAYALTDSPVTDIPSSDGWYFIVATYDGRGGATSANGIKIYVDGVQYASTATNNASYVAIVGGSYSEVSMGCAYNGGSIADYWQAEMGFQFITREVLSAFDIWKMYLKTRGYYGK